MLACVFMLSNYNTIYDPYINNGPIAYGTLIPYHLNHHKCQNMIGRAAAAINVFIVLAALSVLAARAAPVHSDVNQLSQSFRTSVAHSIRDNVARQQLAHIDDSTADVALPSAPVVALPIPSSAIVPAIRAPEPSPAQLSDDILSANVPVDAVRTAEQSTIEAEQAKNAHYSFDTSVKDTINDHSQTRQETR